MSQNDVIFGQKEEKQAIFGLVFGFGLVLGSIFGLIFGFGRNFGPLLALAFGFGWILFVVAFLILMERHYYGNKTTDYRPNELSTGYPQGVDGLRPAESTQKPRSDAQNLSLTDTTEPIRLRATERREHAYTARGRGPASRR